MYGNEKKKKENEQNTNKEKSKAIIKLTCLNVRRLAVRNLNRSHLKSNFSCHAQNSLLARPKVASFVLDMNRKWSKTNLLEYENLVIIMFV